MRTELHFYFNVYSLFKWNATANNIIILRGTLASKIKYMLYCSPSKHSGIFHDNLM